MNVGEFGVVFRLNVGFDLTGQTGLSITFTKPDATVLTVSTGVTVGLVDVMTEYGTFLAGKYALYTFLTGQVDQAGQWSARLTYQNSGLNQNLISTPAALTVSP